MRNELSTWDTEAELAIGRFILEYIEDNPAPADAFFADDLREWGMNLVRAGNLRRGVMGGDE